MIVVLIGQRVESGWRAVGVPSILSRLFNMIANPASYSLPNHVTAARSKNGQVLVMAECTTPPKAGSPTTANREAENPTQPTLSDKGLHFKTIYCLYLGEIDVCVGWCRVAFSSMLVGHQGHGVERTGQSLAGISQPTWAGL